MYKFILVTILTLTLILSGCNNNETIRTLNNVMIKEKRIESGKFRRYYVTLEKDKQKIELMLHSESEYRALKNGTMINATFNENYYIQSISFPKLEEKNNK